MKRIAYMVLAIGLIGGFCLSTDPPVTAAMNGDFAIRLASGERQVDPSSNAEYLRQLETSPFEQRGVVLQFYSLPTESDRILMEAAGIVIHGYIPNSSYLATVPTTLSESDLASAGIRWIGELSANDKIAPVLDLVADPIWARDSNGVARFNIKVFAHIDLDNAAEWLTAEYGAVVENSSELVNALSVRLPADNWFDIAQDERVQWIEPYLVPSEVNNSNRVNTTAEVVQQAPYSLEGTGAIVGEWDGGHADISHPDYGGRVIYGDLAGVSSHATHVAGTVMGSGVQSGGTYRGMAPNATLVSYDWFSTIGNLTTEYSGAINTHDIDISTNSWIVGYGNATVEVCEAWLGNYWLACEALDEVIRGDLGKTIAIAWASSNERSGGSSYCGTHGMTWGTVAPYATAKNVITIGAINSNNSTMTSFSGWGPVDDGRLKPELVAPGCQTGGDWGVTSTTPGGGYGVSCGTSMATPTAAGCFALWMGRYRELYPGVAPLGSTVKAVFCETADDIGDPGPEFDFGFGRINVQSAVDALNGGNFVEGEIIDGDTLTWIFAVTEEVDTISFTLAWDDPGATENAIPTLINDLDVRIQGGTPFPKTYRPWTLDPANPADNAVAGEDHTNNIEKIQYVQGIPSAGTWKVIVIGHNIPQGPQKFSLAHKGNFTLTPGEAPFAADLAPGPNVIETPGVPVNFELFNNGTEDDSYDLQLTSARGWNITPNPSVASVSARDNEPQSFLVSVPLGTTIGTLDTIECTIVSQTDPGITDTESLTLEVIAGYGAGVVSELSDTVGVPGRMVNVDVTISNTGTEPDVFDWAATDGQGWTIIPSGGTESLPLAGQVTIPLTITIDPLASPGSANSIVIEAVSQAQPAESGSHTLDFDVIDFPPIPVLDAPIGGATFTNQSPELLWSHDPFDPFPPGFDTFEYILEMASDTNFTAGVMRFENLVDLSFMPPAPLADGSYFWHVITYNTAGDSSGYADAARFIVDTQQPDPPIHISPGAFGIDRTPTFEWGQVTSKALAKSNPVPMTYLIEVGDDSAMTSLIDSATTAALNYTLPIAYLLPRCSTVVYWRVTATDAAGNVSEPSESTSYGIYIAGDVNFDCIYDAGDLNALIDYLFFGGSVPPPNVRAELNCLPGIDATDLNYLIEYLFFGGPSPCSQ